MRLFPLRAFLLLFVFCLCRAQEALSDVAEEEKRIFLCELTKYYTDNAPEKLHKVPPLAKKYYKHQEINWKKIEAKYGAPRPDPSVCRKMNQKGWDLNTEPLVTPLPETLIGSAGTAQKAAKAEAAAKEMSAARAAAEAEAAEAAAQARADTIEVDVGISPDLEVTPLPRQQEGTLEEGKEHLKEAAKAIEATFSCYQGDCSYEVAYFVRRHILLA